MTTMRNPKGKLVALLAGAVVVVLVAVGAMFWKDAYCRLFLDPRLVGRWSHTVHPSSPSERRSLHTFQIMFKFDRVGNVRSTTTSRATSPPTEPESEVSVGTYRIDRNSFTILWPNHVWSHVYRVQGDTLTLLGPSGIETCRRLPDDS